MAVQLSTRIDILLSILYIIMKTLVWKRNGTFLPLHMEKMLEMELEAHWNDPPQELLCKDLWMIKF